MTNIYKYSFYLAYKFGKIIKTPGPESAAATITTIVIASQLIIVLTFLDALKLITFFFESSFEKPVLVITGFIIFYINCKYTFGLKEARYLKIISIYDKDAFADKAMKTLFTIFVVLIIPIICGVLIWGAAYNEAYIQKLLLK